MRFHCCGLKAGDALQPGGDFLHYLQMHYRAHAKQLAEWEDVFYRFEKAESLAAVEQLYVAVSGTATHRPI